MPTPYRARVEAAVALNATCVGCHADEAAAWSRSMHRRAYDNAAFQAALALEPTDFCRGCHAPEANPSAPAVAAELGVACVTCHVTTPGSVLAGPRGPRGASAPHAVIRSAAFAGSASCASCHEFPFPGAPSNEDARLMQTTLREHARSDASARGCTSCHRAHAFDEVRDPAWLRQQLRVRAELVAAAGKRSARLTLEQAAPGHAFPTGDLFRRLAVRVGAETRYLARHFERCRELTRDDRVLDEPRVVEVPLLADQRLPVAWSVTLERVATIGTGADPAHAMIESEVLLPTGRCIGSARRGRSRPRRLARAGSRISTTPPLTRSPALPRCGRCSRITPRERGSVSCRPRTGARTITSACSSRPRLRPSSLTRGRRSPTCGRPCSAMPPGGRRRSGGGSP